MVVNEIENDAHNSQTVVYIFMKDLNKLQKDSTNENYIRRWMDRLLKIRV